MKLLSSYGARLISIMVLIAMVVSLISVILPEKIKTAQAESSAIIVTVDGMDIWYSLFQWGTPPFTANYLKNALQESNVLDYIPEEDFMPFDDIHGGWDGDASRTDEHITNLQTHLRNAYNRANSENKPLIVVSHSWGTFLSYIALARESQGSDPIIANLFITLGSPLGVQNAHISDATAFLYPVDQLVADYVGFWLLSLNHDTCDNCYPIAERAVNYWAWGDAISGPLGEWMPSAENIRVDYPEDEGVPGWLYFTIFYRDVPSTEKWHYYDSLQPGGTPINFPLKNEIKNLVEDTIANMPASTPNLFNPVVEPITGSASDSFTFSVMYKHPQGTPPAYVQLGVQGDTYSMSPEVGDTPDYENGVLYSVTVEGLATGEQEGCFSTPGAETVCTTCYIQEDDPGNVLPALQFLAPLSPAEPTDPWGDYIIRWIDSDPDDNASIRLFYDTDTNFLNLPSGWIMDSDGQPALLEEDSSADAFCWDTTYADEGTYYIAAVLEDGWHDPVIRYSAGTVEVRHPETGNHFELEDMSEWLWDDDSPLNDQDYVNGIPEGLETLEVEIPLRNKSGTDFQFVHTTLSSIASPIDFSEGDDYEDYGSIDADQTVFGHFEFRVTSTSYTNTPFYLNLQYGDASGNTYDQTLPFNYTFPVQGSTGPILNAGAPRFSDSDGDGIFESGERIDFWIPIANTGTAACVNPRGVLDQETTWGSDVFSDLINNYPDIPVGESLESSNDYDTYRAPRDFSGDIPATMLVEYGPDRDKFEYVSFTLTVTPAPYMEIGPDTIYFGIADPGDIVQVPFTIYSDGSAPLEISSISPDNADTTISGTPSLPFTLGPGVDQSVIVNIDTTSDSGAITRVVTVTSSNAYYENTQTITITGMVGDCGGEIMVAGGDSGQSYPHVYDTTLVYVDYSSGTHIYMKDLTTGTVTQITTDTNYLHYRPRLYENYIVWVQRPVTGDQYDSEIYLFDLDGVMTPNPKRLTNDDLLDTTPRIWGDYVMWAKWTAVDPSIKTDIFLYKISAESTENLTNTPDVYESVAEVHGNYAVWRNSWDIFRRTLSSGSTEQIPLPSDMDVAYGRVSNYDNRIVFPGDVTVEGDDDYVDVFLYDGTLTNISNDTTDIEEEDVTIWGDNVIYIGDDYLLYRIEIGETGPTPFSCVTTWKGEMFIHGDTVVWEDNRNGTSDIYMKSLIPENLAIVPDNISFDPTDPLEGETVTITALVNNQGENSQNDVVVRFYEGDPDSGGTQIGSDQTITTIPASGMEPATFDWLATPDGVTQIYVVIDPDNAISENNELDNKASKSITVSDNDTDGPSIDDIGTEEYGGDGDGLIEDDEQVRIHWTASDPSGIGNSTCTVDGTPYTAAGSISWETKASLPQTMAVPGSVAVLGKIHTISKVNGNSPSLHFEYNPTTNEWIQKATPPLSDRYGMGSAVYNDKIYLFGGVEHGSPLSDVAICDPATDGWSTGTNMPVASSHNTATVVGDKMYIAGGTSPSFGDTGGSDVLQIYDPATDSWSTGANMPTKRQSAMAAVVNDKIYVIGGYSGSTNYDVVEEYNPATDTWNTRTPAPTAVRFGIAAVMNDKIFVMGAGGLDGTVYSYDPCTDTWSTGPDMPTPRYDYADSSDAVLNNAIYVVGGVVPDTGAVTTVEALYTTSTSYEYEVIVGPFPAETYDFSIEAWDADNSPESTLEAGSFTVYPHAPSVISVSPPDGDTDVSIHPAVEAEFSESLDQSTVNGSTVTMQDSSLALVTGVVSYNVVTNTVTFISSDDLSNSETYNMTLLGGVGGICAQNGNSLESSFQWSFTTEPDTTMPECIISTPVDGQNIGGTVEIRGTAWDRNFDSYQVFYGNGPSPSSWIPITSPVGTPVLSNTLCQWDTSALADGEYSIQLIVQDQPPASNQHICSVAVNKSTMAEVELPLKSGWNIVSVPVTTTDTSPSAVFPGAVAVYTWNPVSKSYYVPTTVDPEISYWVAVTEDTTLSVSGTPVETWTHSIKAGWNMIGSVFTSTSIVDPNDDPDGSVIPTAYWWDPVGKTYVTTTNIEPGKGYWVPSVQDCMLALP